MDLSRRTILKLGALTSLATLFKTFPEGDQVVLAKPADLELLAPPTKAAVAAATRLELDIVVRRGAKVLRTWTTTPFAALELDRLYPQADDGSGPLEGRAGGSQLILRGFKFHPSVYAAIAKG